MPQKTLRDNVVSLFGKEADLPPTPLDVDHLFASEEGPASREAGAINLAGRPKIIFLIGLGGSGKTTWARWAGERAAQRDGDVEPVMVSVDPMKRDLAQYLPGTLQPKGNNPAVVVSYLEKLFLRLQEVKRSAVIDFGGGDTALLTLLSQTPGLHEMMEESGVEPVALHFLTPQVDHLTALAAVERAGFKPRATALLLNIGRTDESRGVEEWFAHVRRQEAYTAAVGRGAVEVWFPKLKAAKAIEDRRVGFWRAANNGPGGVAAAPLTLYDRARVSGWLGKMEKSMEPIASWIDL